MTATVNSQSQSGGIVNHAIGYLNTDAVAAAALTITLGFSPRIVRFHNLTDRISDEWFEGIDDNAIFSSFLGITAKLDADGGVTATDYAATTNPASNSLTAVAAAIRLLTAKLDAGAGVTDTNYAALWNPTTITIATLKAAINGINAKLDADAGVTDTDYASVWNPLAAPSLHTVANGTRTLEGTNGIVVVDNQFTLTATTMVASKKFYWEAIG